MIIHRTFQTRNGSRITLLLSLIEMAAGRFRVMRGREVVSECTDRREADAAYDVVFAMLVANRRAAGNGK